MRKFILLATAVVTLAHSLSTTAETTIEADGARQDVARIVRLLGYDGAIHHFKNYVLRGKQVYHSAALDKFTQVLEILAGLENREEMNDNDQQALSDVKSVMEAYSSTLGRLAGLRARGWRTKDIDRTVLIDDASAKLGLDVLREKWIWSDFEEMEFQLGYGKAIHNFKNYLLRGYERYYVAALENLLTANALIARQLDLPQLRDPRDGAEAALDPPDTVNREDQTGDAQALQNMKDRLRRDRSALEALARVVRAYRENLTLVRELIAVQHSAQQIDRAILIYDVPAKAGLYRLRQAEAYLFQPATAGFED